LLSRSCSSPSSSFHNHRTASAGTSAAVQSNPGRQRGRPRSSDAGAFVAGFSRSTRHSAVPDGLGNRARAGRPSRLHIKLSVQLALKAPSFLAQ
jgi:hypothetical protein